MEAEIKITLDYLKETKNMVVYKHKDQPDYAQGVYFMKKWIPQTPTEEYPKQIQVTIRAAEVIHDAL